MHKSPIEYCGTVEKLSIQSQCLSNNLLSESSLRQISVYIPHGKHQNLPLLVDLVGFTAGGLAHTNWKNFGENVPERLDRLIATGTMPPVICAFPDCFTKLGGNQYINSVAMGNWADFLIQEMTPTVEERYNCGGNGRRGLFGKSSGGYGSIIHALLYPEFWSAAACHSGDMGFELMFAAEFPPVLRALAKHQYDIKAFLHHFHENPKPSNHDVHVLMMLAMAASYDPDPDAYMGIRLPVDLHTCERIDQRWQNYLNWDPLELVKKHGTGLKKLKGLYIDCGDLDQYNLVYGARRMHKYLQTIDVPHQYHEFPDNHSSVDYRMDISLPFLAKTLS